MNNKKQHLISELFILLRGVNKMLDKIAYGKGLNGFAKIAYNLLIKGKRIQDILIKLDDIIDKPFELIDTHMDTALATIDDIQATLEMIDLNKKGLFTRIVMKLLNGKGKLVKFKNGLEDKLQKIEDILKQIKEISNDEQTDSI